MNELESAINKQNLVLRKAKKALIIKKEVPLQVTQKGIVASMSTVDYTGVVDGGLFIAFEAKETQSKTSIPLGNIKQHQLNYLEIVSSLGGITFFIIHFKKLHKEVYIVPIDLVKKYFYESDRKSIPISEFKDEWKTSIENYLTKGLELHESTVI